MNNYIETKVKWVNPNTLIENPLVQELYSTPENYESIKENIQYMGILEPLIVDTRNVVISGNLRRKAAIELNIGLVPVIYVDSIEEDEKIHLLSHGQQRVKKYSEMLNEYELLCEYYEIGQGCRTDLDDTKRKNKENIKKIVNLSESKLNKLISIKKNVVELYGEEEELEIVWKSIDDQTESIDKVYNRLNNEKKKRQNQSVVPQKYEVITDAVQIYNRSNDNMKELEDNSVACITCSPPYFNMRDYGTGKEQLGNESHVDVFIQNLVHGFRDCKRVLKEDGSLWVNINDCVIDGEYMAVNHKFVLAMMNDGWRYNDEIVWAKSNTQYSHGNRSVRAHEYIFHFVKSKNFYYDNQWLKKLEDEENLISCGTGKRRPKLLSTFEYRDNILKTSGANTASLRKQCLQEGDFHLTHSAIFPLALPVICILSSSKPGDIVLDTFSGTATTAEAALLFDRKYVGYELNPEFILASEVRLKPYLNTETSETPLLMAA